MRIYAVADIHGKKERIEILCSVVNKFSPDLIVIAGDITSYFGWQSTISRLGRIKGLPGTCLPVLCIRGNSDFKQTESRLADTGGLTLLTASPHLVHGIPFMGANGTIPLPFASRICLGENRLLKTLLPRINKETILVVHPPPRGVCDRVGKKICAGSQNLFDFIEITQPRMVLCGHIHEQAGTGFVKNTLIVNCAMGQKSHGALIDIEKTDLPRVNFLQPGNGNGMESGFP
ncbi:MAG: metallophosphoesterase family protein [Proteobacteria bacterium]|nr:metallophosphoesterase family protein [Pseudomonadota bacterium]